MDRGLAMLIHSVGMSIFLHKNSKGGPCIINKVCYWQVLNVLALYVSTKNCLILSLLFFVAPNDNPGGSGGSSFTWVIHGTDTMLINGNVH